MLPLPYPPPPSLLPTATTCQYDSSPFIVNWDVHVVDEIHKRRKEIEWWFIEGDLDLYVKRIEKTYVGEKKLLNIATYGKEYEQYEKISIKVPFYGYGHYENIELRLPVPLSPNDFMDNAIDESDEGDAHEDATDLGDEKVRLYLFRLVSKILSLNVVF
nr:hypothetical protein [Tanacetum cinerariifolium]